jgi:hypothetical protein
MRIAVKMSILCSDVPIGCGTTFLPERISAVRIGLKAQVAKSHQTLVINSVKLIYFPHISISQRGMDVEQSLLVDERLELVTRHIISKSGTSMMMPSSCYVVG